MDSKRGRLAAAVAATTALTMAVAAPPAGAETPDSARRLAAAVSSDNVLKHLEALQSIADAHDGNRAAGTSGHEASADYVEARLRAAGYAPTRQPFEFYYEEISSTSLTSVVDGPTTPIPHLPMSYSPATGEDGITGTLVAPRATTGCTSSAWRGVDATSRIALVTRGGCSFAAKSRAAAAAGAEAVIIANNVAGALNGSLTAVESDHIPTTGVTKEVGQRLLDVMDRDGSVTFSLDKVQEMRETFNVLAETRTGRADNVVMVGAHLDGAPEGPGINDNGSGSAAILETAIQLAKTGAVNNRVRFVWWGAEELGLLGSRHYVNDLVENDPAQLDDIALYLNYDMVASPNHVIGVYDADESTYPAAVRPPAGSIQAEKVFTDYFDGMGQRWVDTAFSGRSDYQAFMTNGIPSTGLFTGADGRKSRAEVERFGGTAGIMYDPSYHTAADDISNIDEEALGIMSKAIGFTTGVFAHDTSMVNGKKIPSRITRPHPGLGKVMALQLQLPSAVAVERTA